MLNNTGLYRWFICIAGLILLTGCSSEQTSEARSGSQPRGWYYQKTFTEYSLPEDLAELTGGKVTLQARCHFSPELVNAHQARRKMILLPFLIPLDDGSFGPDFNGSLAMYESLESSWNLASTIESIQLYQRWVSSVEQACPSGLKRSIPQCSLKKLYSVSKLWGGENSRLYNFERLNLWLEQKPELTYIIIPSFAVLNSAGAHSLRYSTNSAPIVNKSTSERQNIARNTLGQVSLDWVPLTGKGHVADEPTSAGHCSLVWQELEALKRQSPRASLDYRKLVLAEKNMRKVLLKFTDSVFQGSGLKYD